MNSLPATRVFGQHEGDELARRFIIRSSARQAFEEHVAVEAVRRAAATRSQQVRTFEAWLVRIVGRAYMCVTEHLRGVTPDDADCLGLDERRELDELPRAARDVPENHGDLTPQHGRPPQAVIPTEPPRESEEPARDILDIGMDAIE